MTPWLSAAAKPAFGLAEAHADEGRSNGGVLRMIQSLDLMRQQLNIDVALESKFHRSLTSWWSYALLRGLKKVNEAQILSEQQYISVKCD